MFSYSISPRLLLQMAQRIRSLKRQLNEAEEEAGRRDAQLRHCQRELAEEREANGRLQRQLLDQHLQTKYALGVRAHGHTHARTYAT